MSTEKPGGPPPDDDLGDFIAEAQAADEALDAEVREIVEAVRKERGTP